MKRTLELFDGTVLVVRQIAAVGPIVQRQKELDEDPEGTGNPLPKKRWCTFDIVLVGGTKLYPQIEYSEVATEAEHDRTIVLAAIEHPRD